jgi:hypothetical protein
MTRPPGAEPGTEEPTWLRIGRKYRAPLLVRQFPPELPFAFLGRALPTTEPVELRFELHRIPAPRALEIVHGARAVAEAELASGSGGPRTAELEVERDTAAEFGREVARRTQELWKVGIAWIASAGSRPRVEAVRQRLSGRLSALGFRLRVPRYEVKRTLAPPGLGATEPRPVGYWQTLPTDGVAALFPFVDESIVEPGGVLVGLALADASPVFLDRWQHASYSWGIFGTTGSGKSFTAALTLLRTRWMRPDVTAIVLDPLGEFAPLVRALGGAVVPLGNETAGRLNPLDPATTRGDRREKAARVGAMLRALFPSLTDAETASLDTGLSRLYDRGAEVPTFLDLIAEVARDPKSPDRLATLLEVFSTGSLRRVCGPTNVRADAPVVGFDFRGVPDDQMGFHLSYVLDWAYGRLRDRPGPKLVVVDEAHLLVRDRATAEFLDRVVRHVRHFDAGFMLLSQGPEDFLGHASGRAVLRNLYATAFLRLPEVSEAARAFFGLTGAEAEWLPRARLPAEAGYAESLWRIGALHLPLAIVASTPEYEFLSDALGRSEDGHRPSAREGAL